MLFGCALRDGPGGKSLNFLRTRPQAGSHLGFLGGAGDLNSGRACRTVTLTTEPSPQPVCFERESQSTA